VEDVAVAAAVAVAVAAGAGAEAAALDTAGVQAIVEGAIALVIALQGAVVLRQLARAAIAGHHSTTATSNGGRYWCSRS